MSPEAIAYERHMNLKLAASELGIPWETLYYRLKRQGVKVVGDKLRYGTDRDRLGAMAESLFEKLVPEAQSMNRLRHQAKYDFDVCGFKVDVKSSKPRQLNKNYSAKSWSFSFKRQSLICDFFCCFCMNEDSSVCKIVLVPKEFFEGLQTVSISCNGGSKWLDYEVTESGLSEFFKELSQ